MTGIREQKKLERKDRIQKAAVGLFGSKGFEKTTMEDIAESSRLGVGTLYNYYKSKGDLLLSIIVDRGSSLDAEFNTIVANRSDNISASISDMIDLYFKSFSFYNRTIWREFIGIGFLKDTSLIHHVWEVDQIYTTMLTKVFQHHIDDGTLKTTVNVDQTVKTLYSILLFHILKYISDDKLSLEMIKDSIMSQSEIIINGVK